MPRFSPLVSFLSAAALAAPVPNPEEFMSTLGGTRNYGGNENSFGNVMPDVCLPWSFATWAPSNDITSNGGWWFYEFSTHLASIRSTHQPSPWVGDYAFFNTMAHVVNPAHDGKTGQYANYDPRAATFLPYLFNATLTSYSSSAGAATIEVTPTEHGAIMRFTFPPPDAPLLAGSYNATRRVLMTTPGGGVHVSGTGAAGDPIVFTGSSNAGVPDFGSLYFAATLLGGGGNSAAVPISSGSGNDGGELWAWADFAPTDPAADVLVLRVATSLISPAQALAAHAAEVAGETFDSALATAKAAWHTQASRIVVADVGAGRTPAEAADVTTIFYSSLYRASKFPRSLWEIDYANGNVPIHWSPYSVRPLHV